MKRGTPEHPKVFRLAKLLNIPHYAAVGVLELLWHFTARYAPRGDIGKHPDIFIAKALDWNRPTGRKGISPHFFLINALVEAGWLDSDHQVPCQCTPSVPQVTCQWTPSDCQVTCQCVFSRLIVHDWFDHADEAVRKFLSRHSLDFVSTQSRLPLPLPVPEPEPSVQTPTTTQLTEQEAVAQCNGPLGVPEDFARYIFGDWDSRGGRDAGNVQVKWPAYVKKRWNREQEEWRQGVHRAQKKANKPLENQI